MSRSNWQTTPLSSSPRLSSGPPARRGRLSFFVQGLLVAVLVALLLFFVGLIGATTVYAYYALTLPPAEELGARTLFLSTKIYDRHGQLLYEVFDANAGRRTYVPIAEIPEDLIHATISTEDKTFYSNPGFDPLAIARAVWLNGTEGEIVTAASEAAAEAYFGKQARDLTLAEASMLAGLPQSPSIYDPYTNPDLAKQRQKTVLGLMTKEGYITRAEADAAWNEELHYSVLRVDMKAPHFVVYVSKLLEDKYGTEMLYKGGLRVYTTLDLEMQEIAQEAAREHVSALADRHVTNAALVAAIPQTGEIRVMLGSVDFWEEQIDGQVNVALALRQAGSSPNA